MIRKLNGRGGLTVKPRKCKPPYRPTRKEIAAGCRAIQATWDAREERLRRLWADHPAKFPLVRLLVIEPEDAAEEAWAED